MAVGANIRRLNMHRAFARSHGYVVTAETIACDAAMVERCRQPGDGRMAVVATFAGRNVSRVLARRQRTVVTRRTGTKHLRVIDIYYRLPYGCAVTVFTNGRRLNMNRPPACRLHTIVTTRTATENTGMIKYRRQPGCGLMTVVTLLPCIEMTR